jgi:hypothetical protein
MNPKPVKYPAALPNFTETTEELLQDPGSLINIRHEIFFNI